METAKIRDGAYGNFVTGMGRRDTDKTENTFVNPYSGTDIVCDYFMTDGLDPDDYCSKAERKEE